MSSIQLSDDTNVRVDDQGFIHFEIDDGEDDAPFECGGIGLGYVIDAMEEVLAAKNEEDKTFTVENNPLIEVSLIDNDLYVGLQHFEHYVLRTRPHIDLDSDHHPTMSPLPGIASFRYLPTFVFLSFAKLIVKHHTSHLCHLCHICHAHGTQCLPDR